VVDLSVGWERGQLGIALTASNLFDEQYIDRFVDYRSFSRIIGEPRQVDLTVTWQF
jgi:outer membrane receptor protein involved in Fe transport